MRRSANILSPIPLLRRTANKPSLPSEMCIRDREIARLYYQEAEGEEMDEELCELMSSVVQKVREKNNLR